MKINIDLTLREMKMMLPGIIKELERTNKVPEKLKALVDEYKEELKENANKKNTFKALMNNARIKFEHGLEFEEIFNNKNESVNTKKYDVYGGNILELMERDERMLSDYWQNINESRERTRKHTYNYR